MVRAQPENNFIRHKSYLFVFIISLLSMLFFWLMYQNWPPLNTPDTYVNQRPQYTQEHTSSQLTLEQTSAQAWPASQSTAELTAAEESALLHPRSFESHKQGDKLGQSMSLKERLEQLGGYLVEKNSERYRELLAVYQKEGAFLVEKGTDHIVTAKKHPRGEIEFVHLDIAFLKKIRAQDSDLFTLATQTAEQGDYSLEDEGLEQDLLPLVLSLIQGRQLQMSNFFCRESICFVEGSYDDNEALGELIRGLESSEEYYLSVGIFDWAVNHAFMLHIYVR